MLLDVAKAQAARARMDNTREVDTIDLHITCMHPAVGTLVANGRATGGGRSVCVCEASVEDAAGTLVAQAMGTFRYRDRM